MQKFCPEAVVLNVYVAGNARVREASVFQEFQDELWYKFI